MKPYYEESGITIYHGDARDYLDVISRMQLMCTDPPYGISLSTNGQFKERTVVGDENQEIGQFLLDYWEGAPTIAFASPMKPWSGKWRQHLVWWKGPAVGGGGDISTCWKLDHELIQVRGLGKIQGNRDCSVITQWVTPHDADLHPCQKPTGLLTRILSKLQFTSLVDPFMGSGSSVVAAKLLGWEAIGIEIEERYCEISANRLRQSVLNFAEDM